MQRRRRSGRVRVSLPLACLAVVLGILGMHALAHHAPAGAHAGMSMAAPAHGVVTAPADEIGSVTEPHPAATAGTVAATGRGMGTTWATW